MRYPAVWASISGVMASFRVPSPLLDLFLIPLMPLWSRSIWLLTPYSNATGAVSPNEWLSSAIENKGSDSGGKWKKVKGRERKGKKIMRYENGRKEKRRTIAGDESPF